MEDGKLKINTTPVDVYKSWVNELESKSGEAAGLPYDVTQEVALGYEEVQKRLARSIKDLKRMVTLFLTTIIKGIDKFPYGILYISKVLFGAMKEKFPEALDKDLLKVVGNLVYYRYVNPTIVAPERFDMVDKKVDQNLNHDQRRNLGSIAKILQFAASKKGFGEESEHLMVLNPFIIECHEKFKLFFARCCSVAEPETHFSVDQYTEAVLIAKPSIYISLSELCDTHQLLVDHVESVAPAAADPLHSLLASLGEPSLCSLLGAADSQVGSLASLGKTEVSMENKNLTNISLNRNFCFPGLSNTLPWPGRPALPRSSHFLRLGPALAEDEASSVGHSARSQTGGQPQVPHRGAAESDQLGTGTNLLRYPRPPGHRRQSGRMVVK